MKKTTRIDRNLRILFFFLVFYFLNPGKIYTDNDSML